MRWWDNKERLQLNPLKEYTHEIPTSHTHTNTRLYNIHLYTPTHQHTLGYKYAVIIGTSTCGRKTHGEISLPVNLLSLLVNYQRMLVNPKMTF